MSLTEDQITAQNFKSFYEQIRPYLNGQVPTFANQFSRSDLYSTDEKIIGCWTDGKPLYQRVFVQSGTISTRTRYFESAFLAANIDNIVERTTNVAISYDGGSSIRGIYWVSNSDYFQCLVEKNGAYPVFSGSGITFSDLTVIVSYTKTTDSAIKVGTGTDYSTEEQVIGTWIDGKPLYQKTLQMTMPTTTSQKDGAFFRGDTNLDVSAIGIAQLVELKAVHNSDVIINIGTYFGYTSDIEETQYEGMQVIMCWYNHSSNLIQLRRFSGKTVNSDAGATVYVTIQYTKTTDV